MLKAVLIAQLPPFLELFFREAAAQLELEAARFVGSMTHLRWCGHHLQR